jgi:hypothetical protein
VKLLRATDQERLFGLQPAEMQMLLVVLSSFPLPGRPATLSKSGEGEEFDEGQRLLEEAMKERRTGMRTELEGWLKTPGRFREGDDRIEWRIERGRHEWLLQILNEVRVGAWTRLGSPEDLEDAYQESESDGERIRHLALMEMAGMFQMALLHAGQESGSAV